MIESNLGKPSKESTHSENPNEIVPDSDEDEGKWFFLEIPMPEVFDQDKSEVELQNNKYFYYISEGISRTMPTWTNTATITTIIVYI